MVMLKLKPIVLGIVVFGAASLTLIPLHSEYVARGMAMEKTLATESTKMPATYSLQDDIDKNPLSPPDTSSPRATLHSFLENTYKSYQLLMAAHKKNIEASGIFTPAPIQQMGRKAELYLERAVHCLDLSKVSEVLKLQWGYEGALFLKEILDRIELPPIDTIPDAQDLSAEESSDHTEGEYRWRIPSTEIIISRIQEGPRRGEYLFSSSIIPRLDDFAEKSKHLPYKSDAMVTPGFLEFYDTTPGRLLPPKWGRLIPAWSNAQFYFQTVWQWCLMALLLFTVSLAVWKLHRISAGRIRTRQNATLAWGRVALTLFTALLLHSVLFVITTQIHITGPVLTVLNLTFPVIVWIFIAIAAYQALKAVGATIIASPKIDPHGFHAGLISASTKFIGFTVSLMILFHGLSSVGVSLIPLLASLGVGGLAVALAARPTLENLIGGLMILIDKPFQVGERVLVKGYDGNIENIGWRSTRIQLRSGPKVTIPNEEMARLDIENIDRRPFIRRLANITITYDTPPDKVEKAIQIIKGILDNHEGMDPGALPWVFFDEFNADSLNIVVYYWYNTPILEQFYKFSEKVNLQIMRAFEKEGIAFAFPTTTNYLTQEEGHPLQVQLDKTTTRHHEMQSIHTKKS